MNDTLIRSASQSDVTDGQNSVAGGAGDRVPGSFGRRRRSGERLWVLLHAQALLRGATSDVAFNEDDRRRMAGRRAR
jgi:hypothetical protein